MQFLLGNTAFETLATPALFDYRKARSSSNDDRERFASLRAINLLVRPA